jgi:hypothetical protein
MNKGRGGRPWRAAPPRPRVHAKVRRSFGERLEVIYAHGSVRDLRNFRLWLFYIHAETESHFLDREIPLQKCGRKVIVEDHQRSKRMDTKTDTILDTKRFRMDYEKQLQNSLEFYMTPGIFSLVSAVRI